LANLFIATRDSDLVVSNQLAQRLKGLGHSVSVGGGLVDATEQFLQHADTIIVILTPDSVQLDMSMTAAIGLAMGASKPILLVLYGRDLPIPPLLRRISPIRIPLGSGQNETLISTIDVALKRAPRIAIPRNFEYLRSAIVQFGEDFEATSSVFVMMRFPNQTMTMEDRDLLDTIWETVDRTVAAHGLKARRADKRLYHDQLWENLCIYMIGCRYGLAILEDKVSAELNPNVTLEYGFMRALDRQVALVAETGFSHLRADLLGKLYHGFQIDGKKLNKDSLVRSIEGWFLDLGIPQRHRV